MYMCEPLGFDSSILEVLKGRIGPTDPTLHQSIQNFFFKKTPFIKLKKVQPPPIKFIKKSTIKNTYNVIFFSHDQLQNT